MEKLNKKPKKIRSEPATLDDICRLYKISKKQMKNLQKWAEKANPPMDGFLIKKYFGNFKGARPGDYPEIPIVVTKPYRAPEKSVSSRISVENDKAFTRWSAGDGDEETKRLAWNAGWDSGRKPLLDKLNEIYSRATRCKRASDLKQYLLADLESIEKLAQTK